MSVSRYRNMNIYFGIAVLLGLLAGYIHDKTIYKVAEASSEIFIRLLKLISLPIIFLSIVSTASGMESATEIRSLGGKVVKYTLLTTVIAASVALAMFVIINPVQEPVDLAAAQTVSKTQESYFNHLFNLIPSNIVKPFYDNNVMGVLFIAMFLSLAIIALPDENRKVLHSFFASLYAAVMKLTTWIVILMPIAIWAFITLFMKDLRSELEMKSLAFYLIAVIAANLIQGFLVLPMLLKSKGISPIRMAKGMYPALSVAFFTKSSNAALPMAMKCAEENLKISRKVAGFSLPLCTTINMNGCAAFILITVLFVSMSHGMTFTPLEMILWIFVSTLAAVGNAGVPMGCYFLATAFLTAMNVPVTILGVILPFYTIIDMVETAVNVWSDSCVAALVDKDLRHDADTKIVPINA
jgi:Na+/H+-dicarboxylate symporter